MNNRDVLIGGGITALAVVLVLARHAMNTAGTVQPEYESKAMLEFPVWHPGDSCGGVQEHKGHAWRVPRGDDYGHVATRHRYPAGVATNITAVIHHGLSCLSRPAPQDDDWFREPPCDVMF